MDAGITSRMAIDKGLEELLTSTFEINPQRAEKAAQNLTLDEFYQNFTRLEHLIGFDGATEVVQRGKFLDYRNSHFETYFQLGTNVRARMDSSLPIPIGAFYSIESLKKYLGIKEERMVEIDNSKLNVALYRILHEDNPQSKAYITSLIEKGEVIVGRDEHWNKSSNPNGPRGLNILRKIAYDITMVFSDLGIGKPELDINHGQMKLTITDPSTREYLRKIRDIAYGFKR